MKSFIRRAIQSLGYDVRKHNAGTETDQMPSFYDGCLLGLVSSKEVIHIAQVGANDGVVNDPIYGFAHRYRHKTKLVLIEPQKILMPILSENYRFHNSKYIHNGAVGPGGNTVLYAVKPSEWGNFAPDYASEWPQHRAPTGITSSNREHVELWVKQHYRGKTSVDDVIEETVVQSTPLQFILEKSELFLHPDVLQVDTEGFDDQVIFNSNIEKSRPSIICFEVKHLPDDRLRHLSSYLDSLGYEVIFAKSDAVAIYSYT